MKDSLKLGVLIIIAMFIAAGCSSDQGQAQEQECEDDGECACSEDVCEPATDTEPDTGPDAEPDPLDVELRAHWPLDETEGNTATDISGNDYHGELFGPTRIAGVSGQALSFDGAGAYVEVGESQELNPFPLTISLWLRTSASAGLQGIVNKYLPSSWDGYQIFLADGQLCAWYMRDETNAVYDDSGCSLPVDGVNDGEWHHVAFVVDADQGRLFVDGTERASENWTGDAGAASTSQPLHFGHYPEAADGDAFFEGDLDDVRLWGRALTPEELIELAGGTSDEPPEISDVGVDASTTSATISWSTDKPATGRVSYGPTDSLGDSTSWSTVEATTHSHVLDGLQPDTTYHYRVEVADASDRTAESQVNTFTTDSDTASQDPFPGGFIESSRSTPDRSPPSSDTLQALLPERGAFTFPSPYDTTGVRITNASDCGGNDCVNYVGYSYWANMNNHVGSDIMYIFLGLDASEGGTGPTLFSYNKVTDEVENLGPLLGGASESASGEGWYFSGTQPTKLYTYNGPEMRRWDILDHTYETVFDVTDEFGSGHYVWQMSSSKDDSVHAATLRRSSDYAMLGCVVYFESEGNFEYFPHLGNGMDECQIDKSGRWLVIKEQIDGEDGEDNRIIDLENGTEKHLLDADGAAGHSDTGFGYMIAADNWGNPDATRMWKFDNDPLVGPLVYENESWSSRGGGPNHYAHGNARGDIPPEQQYACGSNASSSTDRPRSNEVICFPLDGSLDTLVVAPVMTDPNASGGGSSSYAKMPKGNIDVTGQYFLWTSNVGGDRLDAFLVKIPAHLLNR